MEMTYTPPVADLDGRRSRALIAGAVGLAVCALGFVVDRDHFFRAWLIAYLLFLGIALGSLALMMIQHLSGGTWGVFRRVFEASSRTIPFMFVLFIPVLLGMTSLYVWTHEDHVQADAILRHKAPYLNTTFFGIRAGWRPGSLNREPPRDLVRRHGCHTVGDDLRVTSGWRGIIGLERDLRERRQARRRERQGRDPDQKPHNAQHDHAPRYVRVRARARGRSW